MHPTCTAIVCACNEERHLEAVLNGLLEAPKLDVPVYIFAGRNDVNAMYMIVEEYVNVLEAPHKELIWLEGGHGLGGDNLHQFVDVMINKVLVETYPAGD
jgi:surfactin synthase thioesterase subunit